MKILAIDTTAKTAAGAICDGTKTLCSFQVTGGFTHSETMLPEIDKLFAKTGLRPRDIELFAISAGPGSFTGVRIGAALIKGLAFGTGTPCVGVSTLEALCRNGAEMEGEFIACAVMDARRGQLYSASFLHGKDGLSRLCDDRLIAAEELAKELDGYGLPVYFFGDGYEIAKKAFPKACDTPKELIAQSAPSVAAAALSKYVSAEDKTVFTDMALAPTYLRASQAEREYSEKEKNK